MADSLADGRTRVTWCSAIANIAAPTTTELNAGTNLTSFMTADGLNGFQPDTASVDTSALDSTFNTKAPGRANYDNTFLRFKKQTGTDTIYNLLTYGTSGFVVIRRDVTSTTANTIGDKVQVFPAQCGEVRDLDPEPNSIHKYEVPTMITLAPNLRATVA